MILLALSLASSPSISYTFLTEILIQVNFLKDHSVPTLHLIYIIFLKYLGQGIKHILRCLKGRHLWYKLMESTIILLAFTKFFLCKNFASSPFETGTSQLMEVSNSFSSTTSEILYFHPWKLSDS